MLKSREQQSHSKLWPNEALTKTIYSFLNTKQRNRDLKTQMQINSSVSSDAQPDTKATKRVQFLCYAAEFRSSPVVNDFRMQFGYTTADNLFYGSECAKIPIFVGHSASTHPTLHLILLIIELFTVYYIRAARSTGFFFCYGFFLSLK